MESDDIFGLVLLLLGITFMTYYGYISIRNRNKNRK